MDVIECSGRSCGYFTLKKEQREVVDILKGERCVFVLSNRGWEMCLLCNSSKAFDLINGTASRSIVVVVALSDRACWSFCVLWI